MWDSNSSIGKSYHTVWWRSRWVEIPMEWYWREIEQWELHGLLAEILLSELPPVDIGNVNF